MSKTEVVTVAKQAKKRPALRKQKEKTKEEPKTEIADLKNETVDTKNTEKLTVIDKKKDEYYYDSSDEEDLRNTIGNIPIEWYDDEEHIGYDKFGEKISKPKKKGEIDTFLEKMEDPDYWRKVFDRQTGTDVILTEEQIEKIKNIASGKYPISSYNPYEPFLDLFSSEKSIHPIDNIPERKARFIPSKDEMKKVSRMVHAIKMGWMKAPEPKEEKKVYDLWASEDHMEHKTRSELSRMRVHMPAPKLPLPVHSESYNPPEEFLLDEEEKKKWEEAEPEDRTLKYIPKKFDALRKVPQYDKFITERFERCLDLYLAPRQTKMKIHADPSELLPDLPNPNDLKPFPTTLAFYMVGHVGQVRSISVEPEKGQLLASGGEDGTVRIWSMDTGRCLKIFKVDGPVTSVAFSPASTSTLVAVSYEGKEIAVFNTQCGDRLLVSNTDKQLKDVPVGEVEGSKIDWRRHRDKDRVILKMPNEVRKVVWHANGDYFASVALEDIASSVFIHQLSKARSQCPFTKRKGHVQSVAFHPSQAKLFVATKIHIRVYDLARCQLLKKCITGIKHISSMVPDSVGDNLFVGGLDRKFCWMDLELSNKPWKKLKHHQSAVRSVAYHKKYPLLASVSDDGTAMIYYARIHTDLLKDNELYPVKRLYGHEMTNDLNMLDCVWHPTQAWLLTAGADGKIGLFSY